MTESPGQSSLGPAWAVAVVSAVVVVCSSVDWVSVLRDQLRYGCSYASDGEYSDWICADGIGYLVPGVALLGLTGIGGIGGIVLLVRLRRSRLAWRGFTSLGIAPVAIAMLAWQQSGATTRGVPAAWWLAVDCLAASAVLCSAAAVAGPRRIGRRLAIVAAATFVATVVVDPDLLSVAALGLGLSVVSAITIAAPPRPDARS